MSNETQCSSERPCAAVQLLIQRVNDHDEAIKAMRDRLPPWVLGVGTFGGVLIGALGALVSK